MDEIANTSTPGGLGGPRPPTRAKNPVGLYLATLLPSGRLVMAGALNIIARDYLGYADARQVPWYQLRHEHVQAVRTRLGEKYKPATANRYLCALKGVLREACRLGAFPGEELERVRDVRSVPGSAIPAGRALSKGELKALMDACVDGSASGARDAVVIALGYGARLRRREIAGLSLGDVRAEGDGMVVRVVGKGAKERLVYLDNGAPEAIAEYIEVRANRLGRFCGLRAKCNGENPTYRKSAGTKDQKELFQGPYLSTKQLPVTACRIGITYMRGGSAGEPAPAVGAAPFSRSAGSSPW